MLACSINMRIFKTSELIFLLSMIVYSIHGAPSSPLSLVRTGDDSSNSVDSSQADNIYDQRQNGSENYRIHVDGVVLVVAPIEGLLLAGGIPGIGDSNVFGINQQDEETPIEKPKPEENATSKPAEASPIDEKPAGGKSAQGSGLRLMSLLSPLLRRVQAAQSHHQ